MKIPTDYPALMNMSKRKLRKINFSLKIRRNGRIRRVLLREPVEKGHGNSRAEETPALPKRNLTALPAPSSRRP